MNDFKKKFNEKMEVAPSPSFESAFAKKLKHERTHKHFLLKWWAVIGGAILVVTIILYVFQRQHENTQFQYVKNLLELEEYSDDTLLEEDIDGMIDLTTLDSDEI